MASPSIFTPPEHPAELPSYKSTNIGFIAAVLSADIETYVGATIENGRIFFRVTDHGNCLELERQFEHSIFPKVNPRVLLEARAFLHTEVARLRGGHKPKVGGRDVKTF